MSTPNLTKVGMGLAFAVGLYVLVISLSEEEKLIELILSLPPEAWIIILLLSLSNYILRFIRWDGYLKHLGFSTSSLYSVLSYFAGFALTTTPGKVGESYRCVLLNKIGVPYASTLAMCFLERILDLGVIVLLSLMLMNTKYALPVIVALVVLTLTIFVLRRASFSRVIYFLQKRMFFRDNHLKFVKSFFIHAQDLLNLRSISVGTGLGLVAWIAEGIGFVVLLSYLGVKIPFYVGIGVYAVAMLVGAISLLPGGLGSVEATMVLLLTNQGVDFEVAVSATIVCRVATLWFAVFLGLISIPALLGFSKRVSPIQ